MYMCIYIYIYIHIYIYIYICAYLYMYIQGGRVPPGATVHFDVQLLSVKRRGTNPVSSQVCTVKKRSDTKFVALWVVWDKSKNILSLSFPIQIVHYVTSRNRFTNDVIHFQSPDVTMSFLRLL